MTQHLDGACYVSPFVLSFTGVIRNSSAIDVELTELQSWGCDIARNGVLPVGKPPPLFYLSPPKKCSRTWAAGASWQGLLRT